MGVPIKASSMKSILLSCISTALLVSVVSFSSGRPPGVAFIFTSASATALVVWTLRQYERRFDPLPLGKPIRLPIDGAANGRPRQKRRLAA
jgi:hypothetical protein